MQCEACGNPLQVGQWPWCPHGTPSVGVIDDQLEGGPRHFETMGADSPYIESKSQWKREVEARGLLHNDRHDRAHYERLFRQHQERLRDTGAVR
jgi:hypothetical protein